MTVYNGEEHVINSLASAARLRMYSELDVLVLDDCSPAPGFSERLAARCADLGVRYYRSPRNLGIPRNVNLALLTCVRERYDYVIVANSDVLFPSNLVDGMLRIASKPGVGSVTAWSNNVSVYSLTSFEPDQYLGKQDVVDWVSLSLAGNFGDSYLGVPAGISFAIMIPREAIERTGLMDPVFGRGYCEEIDWSLRAQQAGLRAVLATGVFVYHVGGGSNVAAGLLSENETTVPANERIIDMRYPLFRSQVEAFMGSGLLAGAVEDAQELIVRAAGQQFGYQVVASWLPHVETRSDLLSVVLAPDGLMNSAYASVLGFETRIPIDPQEPRRSITDFFGTEPIGFCALDRGAVVEQFGDLATEIDVLPTYPSRV